MRSPLRGNPRISCDTPCHGYPATDWAVPEGTRDRRRVTAPIPSSSLTYWVGLFS